MRKLLLSASLLFLFSANSQEMPVFHWVKNAGSIGFDVGLDMAIDTQGNVITVGSFNATFDFDPGPNTYNMTGMGNNDGFIQKLDASGNFLWAKQISGNLIENISKIKLDASGNIYLAGEYMATVDFNPGPGTFNMTSTTHTIPSLKSIDAFIVKLDPSGNFLWAKSFGGPEYDSVISMALDPQGNIILGGNFSLTADFNPGAGSYPLSTSTAMNVDLYISKLDPDGNFIWAKSIGGTDYDKLQNLTLDNAGNIYATGYYIGTVDFNPGAGVLNLPGSAPDPLNGPLQDAFVLKLDSGGNFGWAKKIGGISGEEGSVITTDNTGNVYASGFFYGTVDLNPDAGELLATAGPSSSMYVCKLTTEGTFLWAKSFTGTSYILPETAQFKDGAFYIGGMFRWIATFGETDGLSVSASGENNDVFIAKFDPQTGNALWVEAMGGDSEDNLNAMAVTEDGSVFSTGFFQATADMDPGESVHNILSAGSGDLYVLRLSPESLAVPETAGMPEIVYANPSHGLVQISVPEEWLGTSMDVFSITGQKVTAFVLDTTVTQHYLPTGTYLLQASRATGKKTTTKMIIR